MPASCVNMACRHFIFSFVLSPIKNQSAVVKNTYKPVNCYCKPFLSPELCLLKQPVYILFLIYIKRAGFLAFGSSGKGMDEWLKNSQELYLMLHFLLVLPLIMAD